MQDLQRRIRRARRPLIALVALVIALGVGYGVKAINDSASPSTHVTRTVALSALPQQAEETVRLIRRGGPFPYPRNDGVVFHNDEHHLPSEPDGYYREYTVPTPGSADRGARRIVTARNGTYYYTSDHYDSFERIELSK